MAEWREETRGTFLACIAVVADCELSIIGREGAWFWLVRRGDCDLAEGAEPDFTGAKAMAEQAADRLRE